MRFFHFSFLFLLMSPSVLAWQYSQPDQDINNAGSYVASSGSDLFAMLDEGAFDDADYINSSLSGINSVNISLSKLRTPHSIPFIISIRARKSVTGSQTTNLIVKLFDGNKLIISKSESSLPTFYQTFTFGTNTGVINDITDWSNLTLELQKGGLVGLPRSKLQVSWVQFRAYDIPTIYNLGTNMGYVRGNSMIKVRG